MSTGSGLLRMVSGQSKEKSYFDHTTGKYNYYSRRFTSSGSISYRFQPYRFIKFYCQPYCFIKQIKSQDHCQRITDGFPDCISASEFACMRPKPPLTYWSILLGLQTTTTNQNTDIKILSLAFRFCLSVYRDQSNANSEIWHNTRSQN